MNHSPTMGLYTQSSAAREPRAQGDGSPKPVYTADVPGTRIQRRAIVDRRSVVVFVDESDAAEAGYGHGV